MNERTQTEPCGECENERTCRSCLRCGVYICFGCWLSHFGLQHARTVPLGA
jgi:hypothetical protein